MRKLLLLGLLVLCSFAVAQNLSPEVKEFVKLDAPIVVLQHVRVIDGTGSPAREDQTIVLASGKIESVANAASASVPKGSQVLDLHGYSVLPGLVGMHDHMFYPVGNVIFGEMAFSFPRLYLAGGVTTIRTTGSLEPYTDLELKNAIDAGKIPGPKMHVTGPYLEGAGSWALQLHQLTGPEDATKTVDYWLDEGVDNFKAYMFITPAELSAAIAAAHKRGLKVTGHLCSIGFREAAELGIDNLEHGLMVDSEFVPNKQPDQCPPGNAVSTSLRQLDLNSAAAQETIRTLVAKNVAITSTLPVFEAAGAPLSQAGIGAANALLNPRVLNVMSTDARVRYLQARARVSSESNYVALLRKVMDFERAFVQAGGLLIAGPDP